LSLRYNFIEVILNGKNLGIYALEEHFDKRLLEHNNRREGPIIKFDETNWQMERMHFDYVNYRELPESGNYYSLPVDMFMTNSILADSLLFTEFKVALNLLERFRLRELRPSEIFDIDKLAKYFALCDVFGTHHPLHTNQFRFYYNPITSKLEPVCFDTNSGKPTKKLSFSYTSQDDTVFDGGGRAFVLPSLFEDFEFFEAYVRALDKFSRASYLDVTLRDLGDALRHNIKLIHREFPRYRFSPAVVYENQRYARTFLNPSKGLLAHFGGVRGNAIELEVGNVQQVPVELLDVSYRDSLTLPIGHPIVLPGTVRSRPVEYQRITVILPAGLQWTETMIADLKVNYRLLGTDRGRFETVFPWAHIDDSFLAGDFLRQPPNARDAEFLTFDEARAKIFFKTGEWNLRENLIIPPGYTVIAGPGVKLNLLKVAKILSYSPVVFVGSEENPIRVVSPDSTGQGLLVLHAGEESILEHVQFVGLSNPAQNGWELPGAVTFYESPVRITHTHFARNRSEDALNIVRSEFVIDRSLFSELSYDDFDDDFCSGQVVNTSFVDCVNDAIDVSGSVIHLDNVFVNGAGDKGLSAGENSRVTGEDIEIKSASIGVASKDLSHVILDRISIVNGGIGLTAFQKKSEFGSASINATGVTMDEVESHYLVEINSRVTVDGKTVGATHRNVATLIYAAE
jgi:hypothetical protein